LACSNLAPEQVLDAKAQMQRTRRYAKTLQKRVPQLKNEIAFFLEALQKIHDANPTRALRPIHGSPHPHQWLENGARLGLVDFDRISLGDPEPDVATFIAEMDFEDEAKYAVAEINARFIAGYESLAGELNRDLLRAYRAHKHFSKALKAARAVRLDGDARAGRNLKSAVSCIM
jgi:aminoglycoside phosphotransferase (APT) family kinase protein